jgi:uncharacterized protein (UPF0548 family)
LEDDAPVPAVIDEEMMTATANLEAAEFAVVGVTADVDSTMLVRFTITAEPGTFAVRLPLPSSRALKPWLDHIPDDPDDAAEMLSLFMSEEIATGCAHRAATAQGADRVFELASYGFRCADRAEHRRLSEAAGPTGWHGMIHEDDVPKQTGWARKLDRLRMLPFTYPEVGATAGTMPAGYRTVAVERKIGTGQTWFEVAWNRLMTWDMHRRAGLLVVAEPRVAAGGFAMLSIGIGPWWINAPVRVVDVVHEPNVRGFAYGTLPGHPETGEERFLIHLDADETVRAEIRAFSRPGRALTRLGAPIGRRMQDRVTERYLTALAARG